MKNKNLLKLLVIPTVILGVVNCSAPQALAEYVQVDKDNPALEAKNNLMIEKDLSKDAKVTVTTNITDLDRVQISHQEKGSEELYASFQKDYGQTTVSIKDVTEADEITVNHSYVGKYNGSDVSAQVKYSNFKKSVKNEGEASFFFSDNLYSGFVYNMIRQLNVEVTFIDTATQQPIDLKGESYLTFNSLNGTQKGEPNVEFADEFVSYLNQPEGLNIYSVKDSNILEVPNTIDNEGLVYAGASDSFTDVLGSDDYKKNTVSYQIGGKQSQFKLGTLNDRGGVWTSLNSATLFSVTPEKPTKAIQNNEGEDIDGGKVKPGQELTYKISQKVNTLGMDLLEKYKSMTFIDKLPEEVTYVDSELQDEKGTKVDEKGTKLLEESTNTLTYNVSTDYLQKEMKYNGETYTLNVKVKVKDDVKDGVVLKNIANVTINKNSQDTNEVIVTPEIDPPVTPVDPPVTPEPKPDPVIDPETPQDPKPVTLPATGGMDLNLKYILGFVGFLAVVGSAASTLIYFINKRKKA